MNMMKLKMVKYSPELCTGIGIVGAVTSTVLACKATLKVQEVLDERNATMEVIETEEKKQKEVYTSEDANNDRKIVKIKTAANIVKLYAPSVIVGGISLYTIYAGHKILKSRNVALAATVTSLSESFKNYKNEVKERYGEEVEYEIAHGIKKEKVEVVDPKTGKKKKMEKNVAGDTPNNYSPYSRFFDETCDGYTKDPQYNYTFLLAQQQYANDLLISKGYLFLNDVYKMIGIEPTKEGQIVGWLYDEKDPNGDNFVDFGLTDGHEKDVRRFINGYESAILLDFNVDGNIFDLL